MNSKDFGSTGAKNTYYYLKLGNYQRAADKWFTTDFTPMNQSILNAKIIKKLEPNARVKFQVAKNKLNKNMSKYYNKKLAAELLKIERRILNNRSTKGGITENTKKTLNNFTRRQNNTKSRLLRKLEFEISKVGKWRSTVPISNIIKPNYRNSNMTTSSGGSARRTSPIRSTFFP